MTSANRKSFGKYVFSIFFLSLISLSFVSPSNCFAEEASEAKQSALASFNEWYFGKLFFDISGGSIKIAEVTRGGAPVIDQTTNQQAIKTVGIPFLIVFLMLGGIFFTFWFKFINIRGLKHAIDIIRGKYDRPEDEGEISHFRALTSALSATVGLGNIAGVAVAIQVGGPGAMVWMSIIAVFAMTSKFTSCSLAQMYRKTHSDGSFSGGPMYYLDYGLKEKGPLMAKLGKFLACTYAILIMAAAIGGGNMFQSNQTTQQIVNTFALDETARWTIGIVLSALVALVILGGIKRIGAATSRIVPAMCGIYVIACIIVILSNVSNLPSSIALMFQMAVGENAFFGGLIGVMVTGVQRAVFSNEGGLGSAAIAHAAAKTDQPIREGLVAMVGPLIDTLIVCNLTGLVVVTTGVWNDPDLLASTAGLGSSLKGVTLTSAAFATVMPWFPYLLTICIALFAYSTMISWCYYGERGWIYLANHIKEGIGIKTVIFYRIIFVCFVLVGAVETLGQVLDFSDAMMLSLAYPNVIGGVILAPVVSKKLKAYWSDYQSGKMAPVK